MTPKLYLSQIRWLDKKINHRFEELAEYKSKVSSITAIVYDKDIVQTSASNGAVPNAVSKIIDMEKEINAMIDTYVDTSRTIIKQIESMENKTFAELLYQRYVTGLSLAEISERMNYSYDWVRKYHGRALQEFGKGKTLKPLHTNTHSNVLL